jgi:hypothetical protein
MREMAKEEIILYRAEHYKPKGSLLGWLRFKNDVENLDATLEVKESLLKRIARLLGV